MSAVMAAALLGVVGSSCASTDDVGLVTSALSSTAPTRIDMYDDEHRVRASFSGMTSSPGDLVVLAPVGSSAATVTDSVATTGTSGTVYLSTSTPGTYVLRTFEGSSTIQLSPDLLGRPESA